MNAPRGLPTELKICLLCSLLTLGLITLVLISAY